MQSGQSGFIGGISGIGKHLCQHLTDAGHQVLLMDLRTPDFHVDKFVPLDLTQPGSFSAAVNQVPNSIAGLANVAGIPPRPGNVESNRHLHVLKLILFLSTVTA